MIVTQTTRITAANGSFSNELDWREDSGFATRSKRKATFPRQHLSQRFTNTKPNVTGMIRIKTLPDDQLVDGSGVHEGSPAVVSPISHSG